MSVYANPTMHKGNTPRGIVGKTLILSMSIRCDEGPARLMIHGPGLEIIR